MSWTVDDSGNAAADEKIIKYAGSGKSEQKGNAIWVDGSSAGEGVKCWSFKINKGKGMWLGVATENNFGSGYKLKGLLYGGPGNLSDGGSLVTGHWGPKYCEGDTIAMRLEVSGDHTTLSFAKNGVNLGVAYDIHGWSGGEQLRPVVSLESSEQEIEISELDQWDTAITPASQAGIAGSWQHTSQECQLQVEKEADGKWIVGAKVANSFRCEVTENNGVFSPGPVASTRMMPPPELQAVENSFQQLLSGLTNITRDGSNLVVTAGERSESFIIAEAVTPATKDRIRWMNN